MSADETIEQLRKLAINASNKASIEKALDEAPALRLLIATLSGGFSSMTVAVACYQIAAIAVIKSAGTLDDARAMLNILNGASHHAVNEAEKRGEYKK